MKWATFLLGMVQPLLGKILTLLGLQVVTITGMTLAIDQIKNLFVQFVGAVPAAGLQLAALAGAGEGFGMIFGALAFRLVLWNIERATRILGVAS